MYIGNVILLIMNLPLAGLFARLLKVPYRWLYPPILALCIAGVYLAGEQHRGLLAAASASACSAG